MAEVMKFEELKSEGSEAAVKVLCNRFFTSQARFSLFNLRQPVGKLVAF
ncbi:hypothetical protein D918_09986 [Trichuris suis]|nr:hypothetical protein D918_09986 [Trichuris suis]